MPIVANGVDINSSRESQSCQLAGGWRRWMFYMYECVFFLCHVAKRTWLVEIWRNKVSRMPSGVSNIAVSKFIYIFNFVIYILGIWLKLTAASAHVPYIWCVYMFIFILIIYFYYIYIYYFTFKINMFS